MIPAEHNQTIERPDRFRRPQSILKIHTFALCRIPISRYLLLREVVLPVPRASQLLLYSPLSLLVSLRSEPGSPEQTWAMKQAAFELLPLQLLAMPCKFRGSQRFLCPTSRYCLVHNFVWTNAQRDRGRNDSANLAAKEGYNS